MSRRLALWEEESTKNGKTVVRETESCAGASGTNRLSNVYAVRGSGTGPSTSTQPSWLDI
ncbi:hypothetical protein TRAPUB_12845 [Trametes pubescens]|uniref:Uncharacterized protein n=1 Tax=Trametes pubescens TaxID=154538 RepID=A0A1M2VSR4_TRAPU|nr:hypothetical protein TRAPUB_12845 [Trametes pubescens]